MNEFFLLQKLTELEKQIKDLKEIVIKQDKEIQWGFNRVYECITNPTYGLQVLSKK